MVLGQIVLSDQALLAAWGVYPAGMAVLVVLALHVASLGRSTMPASRRRIRTANGILMMLAVPVLSFALAGVAPADRIVFVVAWTLVAAMVVLMGLMAVADTVNTLILAREERARLRASIARTRAQMREMVRSRRRELSGRSSSGGTPPPGAEHSEHTDDRG